MIKKLKIFSVISTLIMLVSCLMLSLQANAATFDTEYVIADGEETVVDLLGGVKLHEQDIKALKDCNGTYYYKYPSQYLESLPNHEGIKMVSWSYRNPDSWKMAGVSDIAKNFEYNNPGWLVVGGTNADFFHINGNGQMADNAMEQGEMVNAFNTNSNEWWRGILGFDEDSNLKVGIPTVSDTYTARMFSDDKYVDELNSFSVNSFNPATISDTGITVITKDSPRMYDLTGYKVVVGEYEINRKSDQGTFFIKGKLHTLRDGTTNELPKIATEDNSEILREFYLVSKDGSVDNLALNNYVRIQKEYTGEWSNVVNSASYYWKILDNGNVLYQNHTNPEISKELQAKYNYGGSNWSYITCTKARCLFGVKADGSYVMAVVDGTTSTGMTLSEAAYYMKATGCVDAWDFDGGGSATLIARNASGSFETINAPSDSGGESERRVGNALLMVVRDPGFVSQKKNSTCTSVTFTKKSDDFVKEMSNISITIDGNTYQLEDTQETLTVTGLKENTSYNATIKYTLEGKEYQTIITAETTEYKHGLKFVPGTYEIVVKRSKTDDVLKTSSVTFELNNRTYTMDDVDEFVIGGLIKNKTYSIKYTVTVLNTLTSETFTKSYGPEECTTLDYELPKIVEFEQGRVTNTKIVIKYEYQDADSLLDSAYILVNGEKNILTQKDGRFELDGIDRNLNSYSFKLVLEYTDKNMRIITIESEEIFLEQVHTHSWDEATCENPKTCKTCGETQGEALGHNMQQATCENPSKCSRCEYTQGEALGHSWQDATEEKPKTCSVCGKTEGEKLPPVKTEEPKKKGCKKSSLASLVLNTSILASALVLFRKKK